MRASDFQSIPIPYRILRLQETRDKDIVFYTLSRMTGINVQLIKTQLDVEVKFSFANELIFHCKGLSVELIDTFHTFEIPVKSSYQQDNDFLITVDIHIFFMKSF